MTYYIESVTKLDAYRQAMIAAKAAKAGLSVEEFIRRSDDAAALTRRVCEVRVDRRSGWPSIASNAAAHGRTWEVL